MLGALHLSEDLGEARLLAACCNNLADHYVGVGRPGDAVPYARRAAQEAISCGARGAAAVALVTVAQACEASGLLPQAVAAARESLQRNGEPPVRPSSRDTAQALLRRLNDLSG